MGGKAEEEEGQRERMHRRLVQGLRGTRSGTGSPLSSRRRIKTKLESQNIKEVLLFKTMTIIMVNDFL